MNNRLPVSALIGEFVHTEEQLAQCRKFFEDCTPLFSRTANYFIVGDDNEVLTGRACHYDAQNTAVNNPTLIATEVGAKRYTIPNPFKVVKGVLDWMVNESPWSPAIVNKEDKLEDIYNTGIIFSTNVYFPFLQAGLIASRHFYEMPDKMFRKFDELVRQGIHKTLAFNAVFSCSSHLRGEWETEPFGVQTVHRAFYVSRSAEIENMVSGFIGAALSEKLSKKKKIKTYYDGGRDYIGGLTVYYDTGITECHPITRELPWCRSLTLQPEFVREMIRNHRSEGKDVTFYTPPNPFNRAAALRNRNKGQISNEEFFNVIVPYLNTFAIAAAAVKEEKDIKDAA